MSSDSAARRRRTARPTARRSARRARRPRSRAAAGPPAAPLLAPPERDRAARLVIPRAARAPQTACRRPIKPRSAALPVARFLRARPAATDPRPCANRLRIRVPRVDRRASAIRSAQRLPLQTGRSSVGLLRPCDRSPGRAPRALRPASRRASGSAPRWSARRRSGTGPSALAVDPATHTIYVANGNNDNGPDAGGDTVSVIDARRCNAQDVSRCKGPWPTITVGKPAERDRGRRADRHGVRHQRRRQHGLGVQRRHLQRAWTRQVAGRRPATVPVGRQPIGLFADPANHTVYVANYGAPPRRHRRQHDGLDDQQRDLQRDRSRRAARPRRPRPSTSAARPTPSTSTRPPTPST